MSEAVASHKKHPSPRPKGAHIAARPARRHRAATFQYYVLGASAVFIALAVLARLFPYFAIDLTITRAVQAYHGDLFARVMYGVSWIGFPPQVDIIAGTAIAALFVSGLRWEAVAGLFAAANVIVGWLVKLVVARPRPGADMVHVINQLTSYGFPSGHVLAYTSFCGYLIFLAYTLLKPSLARTLILVFLAVPVSLVGLSRIYQGAHWFSDVMGAYLLGGLWLALTIKLYRWGKPRYFRTQPTAPETD
jgi:undecaprenyl-diphosphatase